MNKYQEELNNISNFVLDDIANGYDEPRTFGQFYGSTIDILQELVDKATPMKPQWGRTELGCGNCDSIRIIEIITERKNKFCPDCGVEIDWSKE